MKLNSPSSTKSERKIIQTSPFEISSPFKQFHFDNDSVKQFSIFSTEKSSKKLWWCSHLFRALTGATKLETLSISHVKSLEDGKLGLFRPDYFFANSKSIKTLNLSKSSIAFDLASIVESNSLETLDITWTRAMRGRKIQDFSLWGKNNSLKFLHARGAEIPSKLLRMPPQSLEYLDISNNYSGYIGADSGFLNSTFERWAELLPNLTYLDVSENGFTTVNSICTFIENTRSLKTLKIFTKSWIKGQKLELIYSFPIETFKKNSSIIACDHKWCTSQPGVEIEQYIKRNRNTGKTFSSLTKAARR